MYWGEGPSLGLLSLLGYAVFVAGAVLLWRQREVVFVWMEDEFSAFRRNLSRHVVIGGFYGLREESRFKTMPSHFLRTLSRIPRRQVNRGAILLLVGSLLLLLDFFV